MERRSKRSRLKHLKRSLIFERDGYKCAYCDSPDNLTIDHVAPKSTGAGNKFKNLITCCRSCNEAKANKELSLFLSEKHEYWLGRYQEIRGRLRQTYNIHRTYDWLKQRMMKDFQAFPKIARLNRDIIITEKIDGTNAQIHITEEGEVQAGSRNRWITPEKDNFGFARWVEENKETVLKLGPGRHYGEWWGQGIQRGYGLKEKRFSLFNTSRWSETFREDKELVPEGIYVVPVLYQGPFSQDAIESALESLRYDGSMATPYPDPEGIVIFHTHSRTGFKITLKNDEVPKSLVA